MLGRCSRICPDWASDAETPGAQPIRFQLASNRPHHRHEPRPVAASTALLRGGESRQCLVELVMPTCSIPRRWMDRGHVKDWICADLR